MNSIDIIALILALIALIDGCRKGIVKTIANIAGVIVGIYIAKGFSYLISSWLSSCLPELDSAVVGIISFVVLFLLTLIAVRMLAKLLDSILSAIMLGWINRLLGGVFSIAMYMFVISILLNVYEYFDKEQTWIGKERIEDSYSYGIVRDFAPKIFPMLRFDKWKDYLFPSEKEQEVLSLCGDTQHS